jgi:ABC-type Fe3+-hydroxamate transport system substrate-binding protein
MFSKLVIACLAVLPYCHAQVTSNPTECIDSATDGVDYFPDKVTPLSSEFWNITYYNTYKILKNEIEEETYLLYLCGTEPPTDELDGRHKAVVPVPPPHGVAVAQTPHIPYLEILGVRTQIVGYLDDPQFISSPCVNQLIEDGEILVVQNTSDTTAFDELLASNDESLVAFLSSGQTAEALNNTVIISEYLEKTNEGIYEWSKFFSAFFNLEAKANELYEEVTERYACVAENAARVATDAPEKPTVLWARYSEYENITGWDVAECPNYYCEFAEICSADILYSFDGSIETSWGSKLMTTEEFVEFGKDADHWIYVSNDWDDVYEANKDALNQFVSVQALQVFDYMGSGENAWFENRLAEFGKNACWNFLWFLLDPSNFTFFSLTFVRCRCARLLLRRWDPGSFPPAGLVPQRQKG